MNEFKTMLVMFNLGDGPDYITHAIYQMVDMDNSGSMSYAEFFRLVKLPEELAETTAPAPLTVAAGRRSSTSDSLATIPAPTSAATATSSSATTTAAAAAAAATAAAVKGTSALAKEFIKMPPPPPPPPSALMLKAQAILQRQLKKG
jgi:hypothetical protein